jgi:hypothetical protein
MPQGSFPFPPLEGNPLGINRIFGERLQAQGNLNYLEFIDIVRILWSQVQSDIPIVPMQGGKYANYPCIAYSMELRKAHSSEPKPRTRQVLSDISQHIYGQRFQNIIAFTILTQSNAGSIDAPAGSDEYNSRLHYVGAEVADRIIEIFEEFMLEYTPVFKRLGASEFVYARRLSDAEINRDQIDVNKRVVTYMLTTERLMATSHEKIEKVAVDVRTYMAVEKELVIQENKTNVNNFDNVDLTITDLFQSATPNQ